MAASRRKKILVLSTIALSLLVFALVCVSIRDYQVTPIKHFRSDRWIVCVYYESSYDRLVGHHFMTAINMHSCQKSERRILRLTSLWAYIDTVTFIGSSKIEVTISHTPYPSPQRYTIDLERIGYPLYISYHD